MINIFVFNLVFIFLSVNSPCASNPCLNNGVCQTNFLTCSYSCVCMPGFQLPNCAGKPTSYWYFIFKSQMSSFKIVNIATTTTSTTTTTTTTTTQLPCPICYNGGYCAYSNGIPICQCPCLYSGINCQICNFAQIQPCFCFGYFFFIQKYNSSMTLR